MSIRFWCFVFFLCFFSSVFARDPFRSVKQTRFIQLHYAQAKALTAQLKSRAIRYDERTNQVWIQGDKATLDQFTRIIKHIDVPTRQVLIKARIVNIDVNNEVEVGSRLGVSRPSHLSGQLPGENALAKGASVGDVPLKERLNLICRRRVCLITLGVLGLPLQSWVRVFSMELSAMAREHLLDVVASPRLLANINNLR